MNLNKFKNIFFKPTYNLKFASSEFNQETLKDYNKSRPMGAQPVICYAPFKNLYFGHFGKVTVCCYNRDFVIGKFPEDNLEEIWNGEKANQLRKSIKNNNLDFGCNLCKQHILSKNYEANKAKQYDTHTLNENGYPSVMEFELSNVCNLECEMCNGEFSSLIRRNREKLPPIPEVYNEAFIDQLKLFIPHLEEAKFYGGEPFLVEIYYKIWEKIIEINPKIRISVQTNATILNKRVKQILSKANFHLNISIDSLEKENYERIRKNANFDRVIKNIDWFYNYCNDKNTFFGISACLMNNNYIEAPDFLNFCASKNIPLYFHFVDYPKHLALKNLPQNKLKNIYEDLSNFNPEVSSDIQRQNFELFKGMLNQIKFLANNDVDAREEKGNFEDFLNTLKKHIKNNPYYNTHEKKAKTVFIEKKLNLLFTKVDDKEALQKAFKELNFKDGMAAKQAIENFEQKSIEELIAMIKLRS